MSARDEQFALRRAELQLQCAAQRAAFAQNVDEIQDNLQALNRGLSMVRGTRLFPLLLSGGTRLLPILLSAVSAAGVFSRATGLLRVLGRMLAVWQTVQRVRRSMK